MKGQTKRFASQRGELYDSPKGKKGKEERTVKARENVGFFDLWRYATPLERIVTMVGVVSAWLCSGGLAAAVLAYGEVTSLLVLRHKGEAAQGRAQLLSLFGGGEFVQSPNSSAHMDALVHDSLAFGLASLAIMACQLCTAAVAVILADWAAGRMVARLRVRLLRAALRQEMAFYDTDSTMNFVAMVTEDMERLRAGAGQHVAMCGYLCGSVACAGALAAAYGWQLTLVGLALVPFSVIVAAVVAKYQTRYSSREAAAYGTAGRIVEETLSSLRTVRAYGGEEEEVQRYVSALAPAARWARARGMAAGAGAGGGWLLTYALNAAVFAYGTELCVRDLPLPPNQREYHPGVMVTVLFCTFMAAQNIAMCHPHLEVFSAARGAASAIYRLLERPSRIDALGEEGERPETFEGEIAFENVYFNYPSRPDVKVLRGFSLHIEPGETVALVGGSGSGKSTALQLLQRLYDSGDGRVLLDGRDVRALHLHHYRSRIGVVGQEPVLFGGTIRENIALGLDGVTEEELVAAATTAHAHQFIIKLAKGYDTHLGSGGAQLSGGQKQRLAIARAVLRRPAVLLLDEPTSALDPAAERQVQAALDAASVGRTTVVVSHRLSTIVNASRIVYMEQGAALEQGTYQELVEKRGLFWTLLQADMTTKSMEETRETPIEEEEEEKEEIEEQEDTFKRDFKRFDSSRASLSPERGLRGSRRLGSLSHVPLAAAADILTHADPSEDEEDDIPPASTWALLKLNAPEKHLLIAGAAASFCIGATMPAFALLFSKLYGMFTWSDPAAILAQSRVYAALFLLVAALCGLVTFLQAWLLHRAGARLTDRLRALTFTSYLKQEQAWFDSPGHSVGALCARLATDCAAVQGATGTRLGAMMQGVSTMVIGVSLAMAYSWRMTLVSLVSVPCVMGGIYLESVVSRRSAAASRRALEAAARLAAEAVGQLRTVQSLGVEERLIARFEAALPETSLPARLTRGAVYGLCLCAPTLGYAVSLAYGGWLVAREGMPLEYTILVSEALIYGAWMLAEALSFAPNFAAARRAGARVLAVLRRAPAIRDAQDALGALGAAWTASGEIEFKSVHFAYPSRPSAPVLRGLSLRVRRGATVALVGTSGCGKSTLMQLLLRLYEPDSGSVELDGVDLRRLPLATLRAQLGLVQQEPSLFSRSLAENIAYGSAGADTDKIIEAATKANVHQFIASLPAGYETNLGSGGAQLSGGQKQRIAIARALVRQPKILLLDEATSALDAGSEQVVQAALEAAAAGRTTVLVAHRLATVRHAHTIAVLDKGVVAEMGSHDELLRKRGLYFDLWQQQASS